MVEEALFYREVGTISTVLGINSAVPNQDTCNMRNIQILINYSNLFKQVAGREFGHLGMKR